MAYEQSSLYYVPFPVIPIVYMHCIEGESGQAALCEGYEAFKNINVHRKQGK